MEEKYFERLIKLCKKASKKGEIPVSALIVYRDKIIAESYNNRQKNLDILGHAEINVLKKASKKIKDWRLDECDLYVTLKPCKICEAAINQSRIKNVYYLLEKAEEKKEYDKTKYCNTNIRTQKEKYSRELKAFFKNKRDKKKNI